MEKLNYIHKVCCLNCHFFTRKYEAWNTPGEKPDLKEACHSTLSKSTRKSILASMGNNFNEKELYSLYCCYKGIWKTGKKEEDIEYENNYVTKKRSYEECFFIQHQEARSLEASKELQYRQMKRRENSKQWFITILALFITALVGIAGITLSMFKDNFNYIDKVLFIPLFVLIGFYVFIVFKRKFWDNQI